MVIDREITVLIADDEVAARRSVHRMLGDCSVQTRVVGEATTGPELLEKLEEEQPDVLTLDIMMPGFSGLEALRRVQEAGAGIRVIIISAFDEFSFAQDAVKLGVRDFLVKPVRPEEFCRSLQDCAEEVFAERRDIQRDENLRRRAETAQDRAQLSLIRDILADSDLLRDDIAEQLSVLGVDVPHALILVDLPRDDRDQFETGLRDWSGRNGFMWCILRPGRAVILPHGSTEESAKNLARDLLHDLRESGEGEPRVAYVGPIDSLEVFPTAHRAACVALNLAFVNDETLREASLEDVVDDAGGLEEMLSLETQLKAEVRSGSLPDALQLLRDLTERAVYQRDEADFLAVELVAAMSLAAEVAGTYLEENEAILRLRNRCVGRILRATTPEAMVDTARECLKDMFASFRTHDDARQRLVTEAKRFIDEHVGKDISLSDVADSVFVSSYYLSRVFKLVCGQSFSEYLTATRMERARDMLRNSELSCGDIAARVGYSSASYFSHIFKEWEGCTPTEYRRATRRMVYGDTP